MKITDLKVKRMTTRESRDASGNLVRNQVEIEVPRPIKTIQGGARFGHYLVDLAVIFAITFMLMYAGIIDSGNYRYSGRNGVSFRYVFDLTGYIITFGYYFISELTMGRTIGKFVTQSYVIDEFAKKPDFATILIRSLSRLVPFEAFSCFASRGWHDNWSKTFVVSKTEWESLKTELAGNGMSSSEEILD